MIDLHLINVALASLGISAAAAVLIAAAVADNLGARSAWWIVGVIASAYIVSRGLAKSGTSHRAPGRDS